MSYVHLIGDKRRLSPVLGGGTEWQMTFCGVVASVTSRLVESPEKVTCPACQKRINKFEGKR